MRKYILGKSIIVLAATVLITACSDSAQETTSADPKAELQQLIHEAEEAQKQAEELGFAWNVTDTLLEEGRTAYNAGETQKAYDLFYEAQQQALIAIEQAHYADEHWQMLVPGNN